MKKLVLVVLLLSVLGGLFAMEDMQENKPERAFLGVTANDMTFEEAYEKHYEQNYGILISSIVQNSSAEKYGLRRGDIIMEIDGEKIHSYSQFSSIIDSKNAGDKIKIKFFRNGKIFEKEIILGKEKHLKYEHHKVKMKKKKRFSAGYGGGSWIPMWFMPDFSDLNDISSSLGFKDTAFPQNGFLMQGGGGKGPIGKGLFLGGMGESFENSQTSKHLWVIDGDSTTVSRKLKYSVKFGGVTLDKRIAFSKRFVAGIGMMLGSGTIKMDISQKKVDNESDIDLQNGLEQNFDTEYYNASSLGLKNSFVVFHPNITMLYRITPWLAIRAQAGYMLSYSPKGWKVEKNGESISATNKPESNLNALSFSIGPWFGF